MAEAASKHLERTDKFWVKFAQELSSRLFFVNLVLVVFDLETDSHSDVHSGTGDIGGDRLLTSVTTGTKELEVYLIDVWLCQ